MKLEKQHRVRLLNRLAEVKLLLEINIRLLNNGKSEGAKELIEIDIFLCQQEIRLIEGSLIEDEIDF